MAEENKIKIEIDGEVREFTPEELKNYLLKAEDYEKKMKNLKNIGQTLGMDITKVEDPEELFKNILVKIEEKIYTTEAGKQFIQEAYKKVFGEVTQQAQEKIEMGEIPEELKEVLGETGIRKLNDYLEAKFTDLKNFYKKELDKVLNQIQEEKLDSIAKEAETEYAEIQNKYGDLPEALKVAVVQTWLNDEKGRSMLEVFEQDIAPTLKKFAPQEGSKASPEEIAKSTAEAIQKIQEKQGGKGSAHSGAVPPPEETEGFDLQKLLNLYRELGLNLKEGDLPEHFRVLKKKQT